MPEAGRERVEAHSVKSDRLRHSKNVFDESSTSILARYCSPKLEFTDLLLHLSLFNKPIMIFTIHAIYNAFSLTQLQP